MAHMVCFLAPLRIELHPHLAHMFVGDGLLNLVLHYMQMWVDFMKVSFC